MDRLYIQYCAKFRDDALGFAKIRLELGFSLFDKLSKQFGIEIEDLV